MLCGELSLWTGIQVSHDFDCLVHSVPLVFGGLRAHDSDAVDFFLLVVQLVGPDASRRPLSTTCDPSACPIPFFLRS